MKSSNILNLLYQKKTIRKVVLFCVVIVMINGIVTKGMAAGTNRSVIVGFKHPVGPAEDAVIRGHGGEAKKNFHLIPVVAASVPENKIAEMKNDSRIAYIVNDSIFKAADEYSNTWGVQYIGSQPVHNQNINGSGVKIAVLDTGIDYNHPDLKDNYKGGYNFISNNSDPWDDNCLSYYRTCHGTHVSGTIAAERNGFGVVGVAPGASIYAVKVLDGGGFGSASTVLSGIEWAVDNGMNIISMSIESTENNTAVLDAVNAAYNSGILLVAAGGNTGGGPVSYPAAYDSVIAVTAINQNGQRARFSPIDQKIEVAAPGVNINSTVCIIGDLLSHCLQEGYGILSGTSMAAPHVTGVAALIYSTNFPDVNGNGKRDNKDVRQIIDDTAFDAGTPGKDDIYGYGIVDAQNATLGIPTNFQIQLPKTFIPPNPTNLQNTRGNFWVNYTWQAGIGNITDSYNVSVNGIWQNGTVNTFENITTAPGGWANITVWGFNLSGKGSLSAGNISQQIQNVIELTFIRTNRPPISDSKTVNLSQGNYSVIINNTNLSELDMNVYDNGTIRKDLSQKFEFNKSYSNNINIDLNVQKLLKVVFVPYGDNGTTCNVTIKQV